MMASGSATIKSRSDEIRYYEIAMVLETATIMGRSDGIGSYEISDGARNSYDHRPKCRDRRQQEGGAPFIKAYSFIAPYMLNHFVRRIVSFGSMSRLMRRSRARLSASKSFAAGVSK